MWPFAITRLASWKTGLLELLKFNNNEACSKMFSLTVHLLRAPAIWQFEADFTLRRLLSPESILSPNNRIFLSGIKWQSALRLFWAYNIQISCRHWLPVPWTLSSKAPFKSSNRKQDHAHRVQPIIPAPTPISRISWKTYRCKKTDSTR